MPNMAVVFRQEMIRLARREIRIEAQPSRKASAQFRRDIAELKRQAAKFKSDVARLERKVGRNSQTQQIAAEAESVSGRYSARSVVSQRNRLGLSAANFGKLIGVTGHTVYKWEHGSSRPRNAQLLALGSVRNMRKREAVTRLEALREKAPKKRVTRR